MPDQSIPVTDTGVDYWNSLTFTVDIKADEVEKQIKDYSDRLPK